MSKFPSIEDLEKYVAEYDAKRSGEVRIAMEKLKTTIMDKLTESLIDNAKNGKREVSFIVYDDIDGPLNSKEIKTVIRNVITHLTDKHFKVKCEYQTDDQYIWTLYVHY